MTEQEASPGEQREIQEKLEKLDLLYEIDRLEAESAIVFARLMQAYVEAFGEEVLDIAERMRWETGVRMGRRMAADFDPDPAAGLNKRFTEAWTKNGAWSRFCICEYPVTDWGRFEVRALRCIYGHTFHQLRADVFELVLEFDFLGDGYAVLGDRRRPETSFQDHVAPFGAKRGFNGIGQDIYSYF